MVDLRYRFFGVRLVMGKASKIKSSMPKRDENHTAKTQSKFLSIPSNPKINHSLQLQMTPAQSK
jgi:hypothetical protein